MHAHLQIMRYIQDTEHNASFSVMGTAPAYAQNICSEKLLFKRIDGGSNTIRVTIAACTPPRKLSRTCNELSNRHAGTLEPRCGGPGLSSQGMHHAPKISAPGT
eukprot:1027504-Pelagomonas_calceolata.AAC.5